LSAAGIKAHKRYTLEILNRALETDPEKEPAQDREKMGDEFITSSRPENASPARRSSR